jgi:hypothetical protein
MSRMTKQKTQNLMQEYSLQQLAAAAPIVARESRTPVKGLDFANISDAVRKSLKGYFRYPGSLTTVSAEFNHCVCSDFDLCMCWV